MRTIDSIWHESAVRSGCVSAKVSKPWCPKLSEIRDKKWFWWRIWVDIGRPRQGAVYVAYKRVKTLLVYCPEEGQEEL